MRLPSAIAVEEVSTRALMSSTGALLRRPPVHLLAMFHMSAVARKITNVKPNGRCEPPSSQRSQSFFSWVVRTPPAFLSVEI